MNALLRSRMRRHLLAALALAGWSAARADELDAGDAVQPGRTLRFPRDHGAHLRSRTEWWYATGWLDPGGGRLLGFQVTFFRQSTGLAASLPGRFAPRHLLFAHAALSDVTARSHRHAQRIARWSGESGIAEAQAARATADVSIGAWFLRRDGDRYLSGLADADAHFGFELALRPTQPVLLQGDHGTARKGPAAEMGHYYSEPQLAVQGRVQADGRTLPVRGVGWLDHEWSDTPLPTGGVGWDWIGINLADGAALMAIRMRGEGGRVIWAGGSHRAAGGETRPFGPQEVRFEPLRQWVSPQTRASYPVHWRVTTPAGVFEVRALFDAQELDSRASTGAIYWEGLAELLDARGARAGLGYLEMTGYVEPLRLG